MKDHFTARSRILSVTSYELKLLLRGILLPASLVTFFAYILISIIDSERTGFFNSIPSSIILVIGTIILVILLVQSKLEKIEIRRFKYVFLSLVCWLVGELIYVYYQTFTGIAVPYPSIADIFYLSATVFLSFHLYNILRVRKSILKNKVFLILALIAPISVIYLLADAIFNYEEYSPNSITEFVVNVSYYVTDAIVIFPCVLIILGLRKNDPFIFHWLLISLSVFVLVVADIGYTYLSIINDELLGNTEWLWSFVYAFGYLLLTVSIIWFSKIKDILEYKKISEILKNEQSTESNIGNDANESVELVENSNQILGIMIPILEKAEKNLDILFAQDIIPDSDIIKFVEIIEKRARKNKKLNIRILLPHKFVQDFISSNNSNLSIQYFNRHLDANTVTSILDGELMYTLSSVPEDKGGYFRYFIQHITMEPKLLASIALFERMWLLEKAVDF